MQRFSQIVESSETSIGDLDEETLRRIVKYADEALCSVALRASCRMMHAMICAPRKKSPERMWKWAMRHDHVTYARIAREAGARDLAQCCELSLGKCAKLWDATFATLGVLCIIRKVNAQFMQSQLPDVFEVIRGNARVTDVYCEHALGITEYGAMLIGKYARDEYVMRVALKYHRSMRILDAITFGAARSHRFDMCVRLIELRYVTKAKTGPDGFIVDFSREDTLSKYLLIAGCPKLHALLDKTSIVKPCKAIKYAAQSGDRATCEYARDLYGKGCRLNIDQMLLGAAKSPRGLEICKLAREWFDDATRNYGDCIWVLITPCEQLESGSYSIRTALNNAAIRAAERDNIAVCKFLIEWGADNFREMLWWSCTDVNSFRVTDFACQELIAHDIAIERPSCGPVCAAVLDKYCARK